jgi:7-cyano-7-deazaguanine synthase
VVSTVSFSYGQRHQIELDCCERIIEEVRKISPQWSKKLSEQHLINLDFIPVISSSALTSEMEIEMTNSGLPNTFVPGRNIFFLSAAASLAYRSGILNLVGGMCETDYSGYPDCREEFIKSLERSIGLGMDRIFKIHTPLMFLNKAQSWLVAENLGGPELIDVIVEETHSCYRGVRDSRYEWGYGCNKCPACELRKVGYEQYKTGDAV